jgi:hypothetical protein
VYFLIQEQSKDVAAELGVIGIAAQDVGGNALILGGVADEYVVVHNLPSGTPDACNV